MFHSIEMSLSPLYCWCISSDVSRDVSSTLYSLSSMGNVLSKDDVTGTHRTWLSLLLSGPETSYAYISLALYFASHLRPQISFPYFVYVHCTHFPLYLSPCHCKRSNSALAMGEASALCLVYH